MTWEVALGVVVGGAILILLSPALMALRSKLVATYPALSSRVIGVWRSSLGNLRSGWRWFFNPVHGGRSIAAWIGITVVLVVMTGGIRFCVRVIL